MQKKSRSRYRFYSVSFCRFFWDKCVTLYRLTSLYETKCAGSGELLIGKQNRFPGFMNVKSYDFCSKV